MRADEHQIRSKRYGALESTAVGFVPKEPFVVDVLALPSSSPCLRLACSRRPRSPRRRRSRQYRVVFIVCLPRRDKRRRSQARARSRAHARCTELYSPNATWPACGGTPGASLVVYMGHGSPAQQVPRRPVPADPERFGNPAGTGDYTAVLRWTSVGGKSSARNAVVLLNHLCYAGQHRTRLSEGSLAQASSGRQLRGRLHPGRRAAVIAEAWSSPSYFVKTILSTCSIQVPDPTAGRDRHRLVQERAQQRLRRTDGRRDGDIRVHAFGR
jgi:hypothetical protein